MPRGRAPSPQSNRTDLLSPAPVTTVPGQGYGVAAEQQAAQRTIPTANGPTLTPNAPPAGPGGPASSPPSQGPGPQDLQAMVDAHNGPGNSLALDRPTERPNEPVTAGLPVGPGHGPEGLTGVGAAARENVVQQGTLKNLLTSIASAPGATSALRDLAARATGGVM